MVSIKLHTFAIFILQHSITSASNTEGGKFDTSRRKSYGGTYLRRAVETKVSDTKIDWDAVMDATNSHLGELQDNLLLSYEAQNPNIVHLYPQAIANPAGKFSNFFLV